MSFLVSHSSFFLRVPGEGLPCDVRWGLLKGVVDPLPASLKDVNVYSLLSRSFPQIVVAGDVWAAYRRILRILPRQVLIKVWILFIVVTVVLQVLAP